MLRHSHRYFSNPQLDKDQNNTARILHPSLEEPIVLRFWFVQDILFSNSRGLIRHLGF